MRLIKLVTLTEAQIRANHRELYPGYKGVAVDSIWFTHDLMEIVFQGWCREAVDVFFIQYPEYRENLSALRPRDQFFLTSQTFHCIVNHKYVTIFVTIISDSDNL